MNVGFGLRDVADAQVLAVAGMTCITPLAPTWLLAS